MSWRHQSATLSMARSSIVSLGSKALPLMSDRGGYAASAGTKPADQEVAT